MADKSFGVKELNLLNASGTPTVTSPNNLNLNANTVAISTSCTIGNNLTVTSTTTSANLNISGIATVVNFNATGISTIAQPADSNPMANWTITNNSASAYRFTGPGQSGTEDNPNIYLVRGHRYIFRHNATSSHPIQIRFANAGSAYTDGITYSEATNGGQTTDGNNLIFNVQHDAPAQLFYQCTAHGGMVGNIYIVGGPQVISGVVTATTFVGALTGTASANAVLTGSTNNQLVTVTGANTITGESNLTFDGNNLAMSGTGVFTLTRNSRTLTLEGNYGNEGHPAIKTSSGHDLRIMTNGNNEKLRIGSSGQIGIGGANYGSSGQVLTSQGASSAVAWASLAVGKFASFAVVADANNTGNQNGGDFNSGAWRTRILDTEISDTDGIVSLSSNQFTLGAGNYFIVAWASALQVNGHQARLRDITNGATRAHGSSEYTGNGDYVTTKSWIYTRVTPSSTTAYELQHRCQTSTSGVGFGNGSGDQWTQEANGDTYCMVIIFKEV